MLIKSLYGMQFKPTNDSQKHYETKLKECLEYLGDKYRLCNPVQKGDHDGKH
jgi:hypothetical protein